MPQSIVHFEGGKVLRRRWPFQERRYRTPNPPISTATWLRRQGDELIGAGPRQPTSLELRARRFACTVSERATYRRSTRRG